MSMATDKAALPAPQHGAVDDGVDRRPPASEVERRLAEVERKLDVLLDRGQRKSEGLRQRARRYLRRCVVPSLFTYEQYPPRVLFQRWTTNCQAPDPSLPSFAIVTPSFNHRRFISATINSVLRQEGVRVNYLVQDGASSDGTVELLRGYGSRLAWRSQSDGGQVDAINHGFKGLPGEIMGWLNSDDTYLPGTLHRVAEIFANNPNVDIVYGNRIYVDSQGYDIGRCVLPQHDGETIKWCDFVPQETMFWRRRVWEATGGLRPSFNYALDWDFILRASAMGFKMRHEPRFLGCFRVHDAQKSTGLAELGQAEMQRLRTEHLGFTPMHADVSAAIRPYLLRHVLVDRIYRMTRLQFNLPSLSWQVSSRRPLAAAEPAAGEVLPAVPDRR